MPKYLVACDLDDTLLTKDKKITNKTFSKSSPLTLYYYAQER